MIGRDPYREKAYLEHSLKERALDFTATYLALQDLHQLICWRPGISDAASVETLKQVLSDRRYEPETQSFFLYREAAQALISIIVGRNGDPLAEEAFARLGGLLAVTEGSAHRASTEALGSLPLTVRGPAVEPQRPEQLPTVRWDEILDGLAVGDDLPEVLGRTAVVPVQGAGTVLAVKVAQGDDGPEALAKETAWMNHLRTGSRFSVPFEVPQPLRVRGHFVFRIHRLPEALNGLIGPQEHCAMAYLAPKAYFTYPNDHRPGERLDETSFHQVMTRNARLLGRLASEGMIHSAPIPLFHNRVQRNRRDDHGLYHWHRGGRLDRWLHSCAFPNFGVTGIRDFEHFDSFTGPGRQIYFHIGTHLLSLLLTAGSYFRNRAPERLGRDEHGDPVDARDLFDLPLLRDLVRGIFEAYYEGFTERSFPGNLPFSVEGLAERMVDEMGVDRHMEEMLRVADQEGMSDTAFRAFLRGRGYSQTEAAAFEKGKEDIVIYTGPHLGGFNERISLPELIESVGAVSALCIAGRWLTTTSH